MEAGATHTVRLPAAAMTANCACKQARLLAAAIRLSDQRFWGGSARAHVDQEGVLAAAAEVAVRPLRKHDRAVREVDHGDCDGAGLAV